MSARLETASDRTRVILEAALRPDPDPLCLQTAECFTSILGSEASNLALKVMAFGGVYLAGGIPPLVLPLLRDAFIDAFHQKGRFTGVLARVPIRLITSRAAALQGAALRGFELAATRASD